MSTSPKVKLIIPIENGDAQATLEHLKNCMSKINSLIAKKQMSDEIIFRPKTNFLCEDVYSVYKDFVHQIVSQGRFLPVFMLEGNVDVSVGLLAEKSEALVIKEGKGSVSLFSEHSGTEIAEDMKDSPAFSDLKRGHPMGEKELQERLEDSIPVDIMPSPDFIKWSERQGEFDLHYVHNESALKRMDNVLDMQKKREEKENSDSGIQLA